MGFLSSVTSSVGKLFNNLMGVFGQKLFTIFYYKGY